MTISSVSFRHWERISSILTIDFFFDSECKKACFFDEKQAFLLFLRKKIDFLRFFFVFFKKTIDKGGSRCYNRQASLKRERERMALTAVDFEKNLKKTEKSFKKGLDKRKKVW